MIQNDRIFPTRGGGGGGEGRFAQNCPSIVSRLLLKPTPRVGHRRPCAVMLAGKWGAGRLRAGAPHMENPLMGPLGFLGCGMRGGLEPLGQLRWGWGGVRPSPQQQQEEDAPFRLLLGRG